MRNDIILRKGNTVDPDKWEALINSSAYASPFQTRQFYHFCNTTPGYKGYVYAMEGTDRSYHSLCVVSYTQEKGVKAWFSRRAIIYGGPLLSDDCDGQTLELLLKEITSDLANKAIYIESRNFNDYSSYASPFRNRGWLYVPYLNVRVNLVSGAAGGLLSTFKYNRRREVKLTINAGLTYREAENEYEVQSVYQILKDLYHKRIGLPLPDVRFFY